MTDKSRVQTLAWSVRLLPRILLPVLFQLLRTLAAVQLLPVVEPLLPPDVVLLPLDGALLPPDGALPPPQLPLCHAHLAENVNTL